ncbi:ras-domain-containing protein [Ramaria rubella]|nr:ras-domain-containing protein [Ramaria rubella]
MSYPASDPYAAHPDSRSVDCKVVLMGNTGIGVGKTSLLQRYTRNTFDPVTTLSTTGALFVTKKVYVDGLKVRLQLWDTAGQERFRSMAPMYYRGAHAALLLYDITNSSTFEDVKGWLEELKKNATNDLIIYIVGSKADLIHYRQVTEDRARLSLHTWFPPPRAPTPPPAEPEQLSTFSYIRPRFTSLTSSRSVPFSSSFTKLPTPPIPSPAAESTSRTTELKRGIANAKANDVAIQRHNAVASSVPASSTTTSLADPQQPQSRFASPFGGRVGGYLRIHEDTQRPMEEEEENESSWGLEKDMRLFEVSAKDDRGVHHLFDSLISAIIAKRSVIREREWQQRDSIILKDPVAPAWGVVADEEAVRQREAIRGVCCSS